MLEALVLLDLPDLLCLAQLIAGQQQPQRRPLPLLSALAAEACTASGEALLSGGSPQHLLQLLALQAELLEACRQQSHKPSTAALTW
ncbi:hypothetical protein HaLaN_27389, partial [Haematococcus lacustris]